MTSWTGGGEFEPSRDQGTRTGRPGFGVAAAPRVGDTSVGRAPRATATAARVGAKGSADRAEPRSVRSITVKSIEEAPAEAVDAVRYLIASLQHQTNDGSLPSRLGFTSALAGEGVTFICGILAAVMAHDFRERVCVIDLNWGKEAQHGAKRGKGRRSSNGVGAPASPGLADALRREASLRDIIVETDDPRLTVVTAGEATIAEGQVFTRSERLTQIIEALERHNDRLILDLPPVLASSAAIPLARQAGAVGLVVRQGVTTEAQVRTALDRLGQFPSAGVVLNRTSSKIPRPLLRRLSTW
jgi:Mrp family chromosome partitioning ATPase